VTVKGGKLEYVWVHVTKGAKDATAPSSVVEMDQKDCMYTPRMAVAVVGQKIQAKNGDPILHNVHTYLGASTLFNKGMPNDKAAPIETTAPKEEGVMKWKCDVHPWMRGYIGVSKSGLQAVTGDSGTFKIENVPPGKYTIESWHEKFGTKTQEVTVEAGKPAKVTFKYDGTEKGA
jgi:plastocyanin